MAGKLNQAARQNGRLQVSLMLSSHPRSMSQPNGLQRLFDSSHILCDYLIHLT